MTPGPIGINSATYCGYTAIKNAGYGSTMAILGSATATFALILPSLILMILISKMFMKYMNSQPVQSVFTGLRPAVVALIAAPLVKMAKSAKIGWTTALIPIAAALLIWLGDVNPVWVILATIVITLCSIWLSSYRSSK
jgi:chromate transport protein ChrA